MSDYPETLQIEPTNACNYSCSMCLNSRFTNQSNFLLPLEIFQKIAEESFPYISRLVLYGMGEPLVHPNFIEMLQIARKYLSKNATIFFTTNGSLLDKGKIDFILENKLADEIAFSCDELIQKESSIHEHVLKNQTVQSNLSYLLNHENRSQVKIGISSVIMKSNIETIEELVENLIEYGVDYISISHLFPYFEYLKDQVMFTMISNEALPILEEVGEEWKELVLGYTRELFAEQMQTSYKERYKVSEKIVEKQRPYSRKYKDLLEKAKNMDVLLNISLYEIERDKIKILYKLKNIFSDLKRRSKEKGVTLLLPDIFPVFSERKCPYNTTNTLVIRSDGETAQCFNYLWEHETFLNSHTRKSSNYSLGNVKEKTIKEIWTQETYQETRNKMKKMNENIPYCGDCSFSSNNCFYATEYSSDCWGNEPFCSECPYSVNLIKCLL